MTTRYELNDGRLDPEFALLTLEDLMVTKSDIEIQASHHGIPWELHEKMVRMNIEVYSRLARYQMDNDGWTGTHAAWYAAKMMRLGVNTPTPGDTLQ